MWDVNELWVQIGGLEGPVNKNFFFNPSFPVSNKVKLDSHFLISFSFLQFPVRQQKGWNTPR